MLVPPWAIRFLNEMANTLSDQFAVVDTGKYSKHITAALVTFTGNQQRDMSVL